MGLSWGFVVVGIGLGTRVGVLVHVDLGLVCFGVGLLVILWGLVIWLTCCNCFDGMLCFEVVFFFLDREMGFQLILCDF